MKIYRIIGISFTIVLVGFSAWLIGNRQGYHEGVATQTSMQVSFATSTDWETVSSTFPFSYKPRAMIEVVGTTSITCFYSEQDSCKLTVSQFKQLVSYLPLLAAIKAGNVVVSSNNVAVPLTASSSDSLTDVLSQVIAEINSLKQ